MTDRATRIYEGALQLLIHRNGPNAVVFGFPRIPKSEAAMLHAVDFAKALNDVVEAATKEAK